MKPRINIITLAVEDLERSIEFYQSGLGLTTEGLPEGGDHVIFELEGNLTLVLFLRSALEELNDSNGETKSSQMILSYYANSKEEVQSILQTATEYGGTILPNQPKEYDWGYSGHFKDPDGHIWEIVSFTPGGPFSG